MNDTNLYEGIHTLHIKHTTVNVKENIGDHAYIMTICDHEDNFHLILRIKSVSSDDISFSLEEDGLTPLQRRNILIAVNEQLKSVHNTGLVKIEQILNLVKDQMILTDRQLPSEASSSVIGDSTAQKKESKKSMKKCAKNSPSQPDSKDSSYASSKLPPMKTATDVVNRIIWDTDIPKCDIIIGYVDRFVGIVEKPFDDFSWEDLASLDYYTFAIPKHRIAYFKYRKAFIWHKDQRLDRVFGSRGSEETIDQVMQNYRDEDYEHVEEFVNPVDDSAASVNQEKKKR